MNRVLFAAASTIALFGQLAPTVHAQTLPQVTPFEIVNLAQSGYFKDQGIPSQNILAAAYQSGDVTAEDVVKAAVEGNRVSEEVIKDDRFIHAVAQYLDGLSDR